VAIFTRESVAKKWNRNVFRFNDVRNVAKHPDISEIEARFMGLHALARRFEASNTRKRCAKGGNATFFGSTASETSRWNQILREFRRNSQALTPLRDILRLPPCENVAQNAETQCFLVHPCLKGRSGTRCWQILDAIHMYKRPGVKS